MKILMIIQFIYWFQISIVSPVQVLLMRRIGLTMFQIGLLMMIRSFSLAIFEPIFGILSDRINRKILIVLSFISTSIIFIFYSFASNFWHFFIILFSISATRAAGTVTVRAMITEKLPHSERGKAYGRYISISSMGRVIGPVIGGYLASEISYNIPFYLSGFIGIIGLLASLKIFNDKRSIMHEKNVASNQKLLRNRHFISFLFLRVIYMFNMNAQRIVIPIFLNENDRFEASEIQIGLYMGILQLTSSFSQLLIGILSDKTGSKKIIIPGLFLGGLSYAFLVYINSFTSLYILGALQGVFFASVNMNMMIYQMSMIPQNLSGRAMGYYGLSEDIGGILSSLYLGTICEIVGPIFALSTISFILIFESFLSIFIIKEKTKEKNN